MAGEWIEAAARELVGKYFPGSWEEVQAGVMQGRCPGESSHTGRSAVTDCRVFLTYGPAGQPPGIYCLHSSCKGVLEGMNEGFRRELFAKSGEGRAVNPLNAGVVERAPVAKRVSMNESFDIEALRDFTAGMEAVTPEWLMERSPVDPRRVVPGEFLNAIFEPGERALVFANFYSQGDFGWEVGKGGYRLGNEPGVRAVRSALPIDGGKDGVWYLSNPVSLTWHPNPRRQGEMSRRSQESVTAWRYLVLECDEEKTWRKRAAAMDLAYSLLGEERIDEEWFMQRGRLSKRWAEDAVKEMGNWRERAEELRREAKEIPGMWLKFLAGFPDPIRAIYSSGGDSWHALVEVDRSSWASMDGLLKGNPNAKKKEQRMGCKALWGKYGADPGALTPVRLTRLPGCLRNKKEQRLVYLNPEVRSMHEVNGKLVYKRIVELVPRRQVPRAK